MCALEGPSAPQVAAHISSMSPGRKLESTAFLILISYLARPEHFTAGT
jgi:hypothetical protein